MKIQPSDKLFVKHLMKIYNIPELELKWDNSKEVYPDIWCTVKPATITVTREWAKQNEDERRKRLVHEILHISGKNHNAKIGYSTYPDRDTYSMKVYNKIKNPIDKVHCEKCKSTNTKLISSKIATDLNKGIQTQIKTYKCRKCGTSFKIINRNHAYESSNPILSNVLVGLATGIGSGLVSRNPKFKSQEEFDIWKKSVDKYIQDNLHRVIKKRGRWGTYHYELIDQPGDYQKVGKFTSDSPEGVLELEYLHKTKNPKSLENYRLIASEYDLHMIKEIQKGLKSRGITSKIVIKRQPVGYSIYNLYSKY
jgi:hypothetical protein